VAKTGSQTSTCSGPPSVARVRGGAFLYAFDLLELDGNDLRREPWNVRRETLASLLRKAAPGIRLSEHLDGADGETVFQQACAMGLEGIVAKRRDRPYRSAGHQIGLRSRTRTRPQQPGRNGLRPFPAIRRGTGRMGLAGHPHGIDNLAVK
jgi:bifunctional non-homologous end joining protein LigD